MQFGMSLHYQYQSLDKKIEDILRFAQELSGIMPYHFDGYYVIARNKNFSLVKPIGKTLLTKEGTAQLIEGVKAREYSSIIFLDGPDQYKTNVLLHVDIDEHDTLVNTTQNVFFMIDSPENISADLRKRLGAFFVPLVNPFYGFTTGIYGNIDMLRGEITWVSQSAEFLRYTLNRPVDERKRDELFAFYQKNRSSFHSFIPRAYWGNYLGSEHVEAMGGMKRIHMAPAALVEDLPTGGVYIQLTNAPEDVSKDDFEIRLKVLDTYFEPIIVTARPEVVW